MAVNYQNDYKYRPDIDGLRAIAILSVMIYHLAPDSLPGGFIGVDIFFVISGYLISKILIKEIANNSFSFIEFYSRRILRIFPALITVLLFVMLIGWLVLLPPELKHLGKEVLGGATFASNYIAWSEAGYFNNLSEKNILLHLWSLGIEEQFYIVWPICLVFIISKLKIKNLSLIILLILVLSFAWNIFKSNTDLVADFYSLPTRGWELLLGSLLANWDLKKKQSSIFNSEQIANACSLFGLVLLTASLILVNSQKPFPGWYALLPVCGSFMVLSGGPSSWVNKKILSKNILVWFGLISYPLYLWHWPLIVFNRFISNSDSTSISTAIYIGFLSIILAWLTYQFIEKKIRFSKHLKRTSFFLLALMAGVSCIGFLLLHQDGFPSRYLNGNKISSTSFLFKNIGANYNRYNQAETYISTILNPIDFEISKAIRVDECHINGPGTIEHSPSCFDVKRPLMLLWGDSNLAFLYPGFKKLADENNYGLIQLTSAGCPPIFNIEKLKFRKNCNEVNEWVFSNVKKLQPSILILGAAWIHGDYPMSDLDLKNKFSSTLKAISLELPNTKIFVLGPYPRWAPNVQTHIFDAWNKQEDKSYLPSEYLTNEGVSGLELIDNTLAAETIKQNHTYLSAIKFLCKKNMCLTRVGLRPIDLIAVDSGHISPEGGIYLINHFSESFLKK